MARSSACVSGVRLAVAVACGAALALPSGSALAGQSALHRTAASRAPAGHVIVVMRGQATPARVPGTATTLVTGPTAQAQQAAVRSAIVSSGGRVGAAYTLINAVAATVTQAQADRLAADPNVAEVIPDARIATPAPAQSTGAAPADPDVDASGGVDPAPNVCPDQASGVQAVPEPVAVTRADSDQPGAVTARSLGYDGTGVTVAYMAEGIDIDNPDFIRDGHSIFTDYQDFSGDGTHAPTSAGEAFLDASAIGAQGNQTYDVSHFSKLPLNRPCLVKVEGEAPGVDLVGLKVFGEKYTTTSGFLSAIQYAVQVDHVDVLNQSFGGSPFPDTSQDVVRAADEAAVAAGTTITVSTGDAGITNTIASPASDPAVIAVGATTTYRFDLQTGYAAARFPGIGGWLDDNISSLSSAGVGQQGRTVDLIAPGELSYAVCTPDPAMYQGCFDYAGQPSPVEASGGTSESAPRVAGVAALVIQAYRAGHQGASPTPAEVKSILTSTADDVDAPAEQQGAGLVDAARAVQLAAAAGGPGTASAAVLSTSQGNLTSIGSPGGTASFTERLTNESATPQTVQLSSRTLGAYHSLSRSTVDLEDGSSPTYVDFQGLPDNYAKVTFTVPAGADRLQASIAYQAATSSLAARVRLTLVDPQGRLAGYSLPQGIGNYGHSEVARPAPGTWTAYVTSRQTSAGGTTGPVVFAAGTASYTSFGTVSPATLELAPGDTGAVRLTVPRGSTPGDVTGSLVVATAPLGGPDPVAGAPDALADTGTTTVPVVLRSVVPAGSQSFTRTLTGPNGRDGFPGVTDSYQVRVRPGTPELNASLVERTVQNNQVEAVLVSPQGDATAFASNVLITGTDAGVPTTRLLKGLQLHTLDPQPGLWTLTVVFAPVVNGQEISSRFRVATSNRPVATTTTVPDSTATHVAVGHQVTREITVTNDGPSVEAYFLDPRSTEATDYELTPLTSAKTSAPYSPTKVPSWLVPTDTTALVATASTTGDQPFTFDLFGPLGDPDIASDAGLDVTASYQADPVTPGVWGVTPGQVGPAPQDGSAEKPEPVQTSLTAHTLAFDSSVVSETGDLWRLAIHRNAGFAPVLVRPGESVTLQVRLKPTSTGTKFGVIYLDDANLVKNSYGTVVSPNGNQVAAIPYTYRAVAAAAE